MLDHEEVRRCLAAQPPRHLPQDGLRPAAVLLPLFVRDGEDWVLFTRRTEKLNHHSGEISFPGGAWHVEDAGPLDTALRETEEEMGIAALDVRVLGRLDDCISIHGYHVVPFVGTFPAPYPYRVNRNEVAEVIELPLARLCDPAVYHEEDWRHRGRIFPVGFFTIGSYQVWGLTAEILRRFLQRVYGV
ncbi:CoA pyrophosphatase [Trichloromonas sp.]|uniref:CoA pyrophosphatase n=1 Tax=Trichloromonas sp. TaxID=3069249 RepID=UPI002A394892|nr:CoA pyrophosphatase [Trichloromonas sp.]